MKRTGLQKESDLEGLLLLTPQQHLERYRSLSAKEKHRQYPTFSEAGERLGVSSKTIGNWLNGQFGDVKFFWMGNVRHLFWPHLLKLVELDNSEKLENR